MFEVLAAQNARNFLKRAVLKWLDGYWTKEMA